MLLLAVYLRLVLRGWRGDPCGFKSHQPHHIEIIEACFDIALKKPKTLRILSVVSFGVCQDSCRVKRIL